MYKYGLNYQKYREYSRRRSSKGRKTSDLAVALLLGLLNGIILASGLIGAILRVLLWQPILFLGRFFFYRAAVPFYSLYLKTIKRLGIKDLHKSLLGWIFNQKMVHVLVVALTVSLISINLAPGTKASGLTEKAGRTILAQIVQGEFSGFSEDEQFIVETFDREAVITDIQQSYLDNLSAFRPQPRASFDADFDEEEESMPTIQGGASLVKPDIAATRITKQPRTQIIEYVVQTGDTISTIAQELEITVSTILWENNLSAYSIIRPGQKLSILPVSGITHNVKSGETVSAIAKKYSLDEDKVMAANNMAVATGLQVGQKLVLPGARKITYAQPAPKTYTGFSAIVDIVTSEPRPSGNKMAWPTQGARISQYYSWRHHGLDIANKAGTPIFAADSGVVELVGWGTGYGNQIVVDHGGGKKTRYAHLSKFGVKRGDQVSFGQHIGEMGSTGWSTGPHLHFEVVINGVKQNPLNFIK